MVRKSRWRLLAVGALMIASIAAAPFVPYFWVPGVVLALTGVYLVVWATVGKGGWCRACKKFSAFPR